MLPRQYTATRRLFNLSSVHIYLQGPVPRHNNHTTNNGDTMELSKEFMLE